MPTVAQHLEHNRRELLDLSSRNRLLSIPTTSKNARLIHIVDERSDQVFRITYHRHDTQMLYHTIVSEVVKSHVEKITAAKGVKLLRTYDHNPILEEFYKPVNLSPVVDAVSG